MKMVRGGAGHNAPRASQASRDGRHRFPESELACNAFPCPPQGRPARSPPLAWRNESHAGDGVGAKDYVQVPEPVVGEGSSTFGNFPAEDGSSDSPPFAICAAAPATGEHQVVDQGGTKWSRSPSGGDSRDGRCKNDRVLSASFKKHPLRARRPFKTFSVRFLPFSKRFQNKHVASRRHHVRLIAGVLN